MIMTRAFLNYLFRMDQWLDMQEGQRHENLQKIEMDYRDLFLKRPLCFLA